MKTHEQVRCRESRGPLHMTAAVLLLLGAIGVAGALHAQEVQVEGVIRSDTDGDPVPAVTVTLEGTDLRSFSDASGRFRFGAVPTGDQVFAVERLGFRRTEVSVTVDAEGTRPFQLEILISPEPVMVQGVVASVTGEFQRRVETPASVSRLDGADIREVNPTHPFEIMNRVPGVWVSPTSTEGHMTAIRQPITTNPVYLFLEDGVPTRSPGFFNHNALYEVNVPHAGGVEVIRGPGTALYGSDAIGGVVDVGTRAPATDAQFDGTVEGNSLGFGRVLLSGSGTMGRNGFRADLNFTDGDDWRDDGDYDRRSATLRWDRSLRGGMSLRTTATYSNVFQSDPSVVTRDDLDTDPSINRHPITFREVEAFRFQTRFERRGDRSVLHVTPFVRWNSLDLMPSWMLTYDPVIYESGHSSLGLMTRYNRELVPGRAQLTAGLDVDRSPGERTEHRIDLVREDGIAVDWSRDALIYDYAATFLGVSPYLQLHMRPLPALHVNAGLRYDHTEFRDRTRLPPLQTGPHRRPEDTTVRHSNLGPSLGGALTVSPEVNFFAGFRESFRSPSEGQLFRQGAAEGTVDLQPVRARSFEGGVRGELSERLAYEVALYRMDVRDDILSFVRPEDGLTESVNAGRTRHQGVEVGLTAALPGGFETDASLTRASHEFLEWQPRANVDYAGNTMPQAPRHLGSVRLRRSLPGLQAGVAELEWVRMGSLWMDPENENRYQGHELWNLRVEAPLAGGFALSARVMNLLDERYAERATYNAFRGEELQPGKPRAVQVGLRYGWNR